jgi:hypothetical protein
MTDNENVEYDERGRKIVERLPHGEWVEYESGARFFEPDNPNCWMGEDCPDCSRTDEERTAYYAAKRQESEQE